jgi:hypothetical protein
VDRADRGSVSQLMVAVAVWLFAVNVETTAATLEPAGNAQKSKHLSDYIDLHKTIIHP